MQRILYGNMRATGADLAASQGCGGIAAMLAGYAAWLGTQFWLWALLAVIVTYKYCTWGKEAAYTRAYEEYDACERRIFDRELDDDE